MMWQLLSLVCMGPAYLLAAILLWVWNWEAFYLICFLVGFSLAIISFLSGALHLHLPTKLHLHVDNVLHDGLHHGGHLSAPHMAGHTSAPEHIAAVEHGVSIFNTFSMMAFLAWFGGTGYLLTRSHSYLAVVVFVIAGMVGLTGAAIVFWFLAKVLMAHDKPLDAADFEMVGVLAKVNTRIRPGGTGEIVFELAGTRRSAGARAEDGSRIDKGTEVVVTRFENGIAYVRTWEDMTGETEAAAGDAVR